jgi:glycerophosphoryl diester phosphodiesterase
MYNWLFRPPSLQDIISWQLNLYEETGRLVGIYPELKHPDFYNSMVSACLGAYVL